MAHSQQTNTPVTQGKRAGPKQKRQTAQAIAWQALDKMLGKANKVIDRELDDRTEVAVIGPDGNVLFDDDGNMVTMVVGGNPKVAMWLIDKITGNTNGLILKEIEADLSTIQGVIDAAQRVVEHVLLRQMSIDDGTKTLQLLHNYCSLRAFDHIEELRGLIEEFETQAKQGTLGQKMDGKLMPQWGRLAADTKTANQEPAE